MQGVVLGLAGAGNIGVVIDFLFAPKIAEKWGWESVFLVGAIMAIVVWIAYAFLAKDAPESVYKARPKNSLITGNFLKIKIHGGSTFSMPSVLVDL